MSLRAQLALSKNVNLQRKLETTVTDFKKSFKTSRRRLNALEEECVSSLYKLLLYGKSKQEEENENDKKTPRNDKATQVRRPHSVFDVSPKIAEAPAEQTRPYTALSGRSYKQSYSFMKDGIDIGKNRKDRFLSTRKQKKKTEDEVVIERRNRTTDINTDTTERIDDTDSKLLKNIPNSDINNSFMGLKRPHTSNTLLLPGRSYMNQRTSTPETEIYARGFLPSPDLQNGELPPVQVRPITRLDTSSAQKNHTSVSILISEAPIVIMQKDEDGDIRHMNVKIETTKSNGIGDETSTSRNENNATPRLSLGNDASFDEELLPLHEDEKTHLETIMHDNREVTSSYSNTTKPSCKTSRKFSDVNKLSQDDLLKLATEKSEKFLTEYTKKSKLFGYVLKTRTSVVAPREMKTSYRSPCITYQELVSIKANIKQHESRTRLLLQRSAKLSTYVDKLANAGNMRRHHLKC